MATAEQTPDSGVDLARVALRQAKEAARARGNAPQKKKIQRSSYRHTRGDGRDPLSLQGVVQQLVVDRGWERGTDGGGLVARWPAIMGSRAKHWPVHKYDEETGTLTVLCVSDSWAKMLELTARNIVTEVNEALGKPTLQRIVVRKATGSAGRDQRAQAPEAVPQASPAAATSDKFRPTGAQPGDAYRAAREGLREERIAALTESPVRVTRDPRFVLKEPEDAFADAVALEEQLAAAARRKADPRAQAIARARRERKARTAPPAPAANPARPVLPNGTLRAEPAVPQDPPSRPARGDCAAINAGSPLFAAAGVEGTVP
ncbi:DUF721 domain-containing protein [Streptomyces sp. H27-C3]|uniref:DUF721 domain-containing protein n=1 Tax=Streptomyces sp. H27-C3 TaxID=3046305 RepID=UPI0024B897AA|nr:DUF721 domain-containing protein [Streptomyces sp. H27-C3]MDJ0466115.1 DUF721 domain-containing protein [Streptomyces sp. H27-C3]